MRLTVRDRALHGGVHRHQAGVTPGWRFAVGKRGIEVGARTVALVGFAVVAGWKWAIGSGFLA